MKKKQKKTLQTNAFQLVKLYSSASASNTFLVQAAILAKIQLAFWVFFSSYDVAYIAWTSFLKLKKTRRALALSSLIKFELTDRYVSSDPFLPLIPFLNHKGWQMTIPNCPQNQISSWHHVTSSLNKQFFGDGGYLWQRSC